MKIAEMLTTLYGHKAYERALQSMETRAFIIERTSRWTSDSQELIEILYFKDNSKLERLTKEL